MGGIKEDTDSFIWMLSNRKRVIEDTSAPRELGNKHVGLRGFPLVSVA